MRFSVSGQATLLRSVWVWLDLDKYVSLFKQAHGTLSYLVCRLELLDGCCVAIFASVLPDASAIFWCERGRIHVLALTCSPSSILFRLQGSHCLVHLLEYVGRQLRLLPLVGLWLVENTDADSSLAWPHPSQRGRVWCTIYQYACCSFPQKSCGT